MTPSPHTHGRSHVRFAFLAGVLAILLPAGFPWAGEAGSPAYWPVVHLSRGTAVRLAPGIVYARYRLRTSAGPLSIHQLRVDLGTPSVRLSTALANNRLISADETVSSMMCHWASVVAGVNGDFFDIGDSGMPLNIMVKDGDLLRSPSGWAALAIGKDGGARIARFHWAASVVVAETRQSYWISGLNTGIEERGITVISSVRGYGAPVPPPGVRQTVAELAPVTPGDPGGTRYTVRQLWPQQAFYAPFPAHELLLVGRGGAAVWLREALRPGMAVDVLLRTDPDWRPFATIVGGGPLLVQNGRLVNDPYNPVPDERYVRHPVSAVGIGRDGRTMLIVAVDGRQPRLSIGLTQPQLAAYMQWLGAYQAMEFDSGGSVTMAVRLPGAAEPVVVNSPSDGRERAVANALLIFSFPFAKSR
jgi:hypothetical protein